MSGLSKSHDRKNYTDEWYTPVYAITPILKYLKPKSTIWCPFDTKESNYYKELTKAGHKVVTTHIDRGGDFLKINVSENVKSKVDYIISNPPYSKRNQILKKLYEIEIPFAVLIPLASLETPGRSKMFKDNGVELMIFDGRVAFIPSEETVDRLIQEAESKGKIFKKSSGASMNTSYFCKNVLPKELMFEKLIKKQPVIEISLDWLLKEKHEK